MSVVQRLHLVDVIHRSLINDPDSVKPLIKYLGMDQGKISFSKNDMLQSARNISDYLREMGSNDIATFFRGKGVQYEEIVVDVAEKLGAKEVSKDNGVVENESIILKKLFSDALDNMSYEEKKQLFSSMGIKEGSVPYGASGTIIVQMMLSNLGGFATYRIALIVANLVSKALLGSGLSFAANALLTRSIGVMLGPVGWIATGAWLAVDLAGPAYRKTVPAVIHVAMLRQDLLSRINIGIVGDGSSGKDSLIKAVFGLDTGNVHPVAGSTKEAMSYSLDSDGKIVLVNYPGFNDINNNVNAHTKDMLPFTDVFIMVVDISRGISGVEKEILQKLRAFGRPILICLNKMDLLRPKDKEHMIKAAHERFMGVTMIETVFDPDPRLASGIPSNCQKVYQWVSEQLRAMGKYSSPIPKGKPHW